MRDAQGSVRPGGNFAAINGDHGRDERGHEVSERMAAHDIRVVMLDETAHNAYCVSEVRL